MNRPHTDFDFAPCSIEAEQALLGAVLMNNDSYALVADIVEEQHFFEGLHQSLWRMIRERVTAGQQVSVLTLVAVLGKDVALDIGGGTTVAKYLARIVAEAVTIIGAPDYARTIRDLWARRRMIEVARDMQARAVGGFGDQGADAIIEAAEADLTAIRYGKSVDGVVTIDGALTASIDNTAKAYQGHGAAGLTTGITLVDELIGPMMPGDLVTLLGASGNGKSALAAQILMHNARPSLDTLQGGKAGLMFSLEMEAAQLARRMIAVETGVTSRAQRAGEILPAEFELMTDAAKRLAAHPILIDQTPAQTVARIVRKARALKKRHRLELIVVDHLLEIRPDNPRWSKIDTVENAVRDLKALAKELQVVVLLLAQATREGQKREHWRLRTSDIWGGDAVKQSSDLVLSIAIPSVWLAEREPDQAHEKKAWDKWVSNCQTWVGKAEIGAPKVRDGESGGWRRVTFDGKRTCFGE